MSRVRRWVEARCPWCQRDFQYAAGRKHGTCGRRRCVRHAQHHIGQETGRGTQRPVSEAFLASRGPSVHHCGQPLLFGTDGFGHGVEWCGRCGTSEYTKPDASRWRVANSPRPVVKGARQFANSP